MGSKGSNTTTSTSAPAPAAMAAYQSLLDRAQGVAGQPYQAYTGELTAPMNAQQNLGVGNINQNAGFAQPFIAQGADYANRAAQYLSPEDIARYQNPYTQGVVNATQAQFDRQNAQAQERLKGSAIAQGALGGNRANIAAADLGYQQQLGQAPVIAGLYNQSYNSGLQAAQQQQQNLGNAAYSLGNLGVAGQNAALTGAGAQLGAGSLQQQTEQQKLAALYQQFQIAQAFPYQQTQWLAGIDTGVGSQLGGTSSTTAPAPNPLAQYAGVGLLGASMFLKRGGGVAGYDGGGTVGGEPYAGVGWIPRMNIAPGRGIPAAPGVAAPPQGMSIKDGMSLANGFRGRGDGLDSGGTWLGNYGATPQYADQMGSWWAQAGQGVGPWAPMRHGGFVRGYDDGGEVDATLGAPFDTFGSRFGSFVPGSLPQQDSMRDAYIARNGADPAWYRDEAPEAANVPLPRARPDAGVLPPNAMQTQARGVAAPVAGVAPRASDERRFGLGVLPNDLRMPLMAAGLGMLASRSPNIGNAIGEGGLAGLNTYAQQKQQAYEREQKAQQFQQQSRRLDLDARRLDQVAEQSRKHLELQTKTLASTEAYRTGMLERENNQYIGNNEEGFPVYVDKRSGKETVGTTKLQGKAPAGYVRNPDGTMSAIKGGPSDPEQLAAVAKAKTTGGVLPDDTADFLADRVLAGDAKALTNLGRGAQGAENIIKVQSLVARKAAERGMNPSDILAKVAEQSGLTAQQRTFGTQVARMAVNSTEAEGAIQQGLEVSKKVGRTRFVPVNKLIQMAEANISDPDLLEFRAANLAIINTYARAISPTGVPTVHDKEEAMKVVSAATSPEAYERVMGRMLKEIEIAHKAPLKAKQEMENIRKSGTQSGAAAPAAAPEGGSQREQALDWANANPNDPRAAEIKKRLGAP